MVNNVLEELKNTFLFYDNRLPEKEVIAWILKNINTEDYRDVVNQIICYEDLCKKRISLSDIDQVLYKWRKED